MRTQRGRINVYHIGLQATLTVRQAGDPYDQYLHYDSFADTNNVLLANHVPEKAAAAYAEVAGTFDIQSNACARKTAVGNYPNFQVAAGANFDATWVINSRATACSTGCLFRCDGADHPWDTTGWYCEVISEQVIRLWNNNGGWSVKYNGSTTPSAGVTNTVRILTSGNSITVWLNAAQEIAVANDSYQATATSIGFLINHDQETTAPYSTLDSLTAA